MSLSSAAFFSENFAGTVSVFSGAPGTAKAPLTNTELSAGFWLGACELGSSVPILPGRSLLRLFLLLLLLRLGGGRRLLGDGKACAQRRAAEQRQNERTGPQEMASHGALLYRHRKRTPPAMADTAHTCVAALKSARDVLPAARPQT